MVTGPPEAARGAGTNAFSHDGKIADGAGKAIKLFFFFFLLKYEDCENKLYKKVSTVSRYANTDVKRRQKICKNAQINKLEIGDHFKKIF